MKILSKKTKNIKNTLIFISLSIFSSTAISQVGLGESLLRGAGVTGKENASLVLPTGVDSNSYEAFTYYEKLCKKQIFDACLLAAKISRLDPPPKQIFDLPEARRIALSLQLLERAIDGDNLEAMELAYDLYYVINPIERAFYANADDARAEALLKMMLDKNYPGGIVRQAKIYLVHPDYLLNFSKKKEACLSIRPLEKFSNLTESTKKILDDLNSGNTYLLCKVY